MTTAWGPAVEGRGPAGEAGPLPHQRFSIRLAHRLCRLAGRPVVLRPIWQRILFPFVGLACLCLAAFGAALPVVPGWLFAIPGLWFISCSRMKWEARVRLIIRGLLLRWIKRLRHKEILRAGRKG